MRTRWAVPRHSKTEINTTGQPARQGGAEMARDKGPASPLVGRSVAVEFDISEGAVPNSAV